LLSLESSQHRIADAHTFRYGGVSCAAPVGNTAPYHNSESGHENNGDGFARWIEAGLAKLADGGIERWRVKVVAKCASAC
jgi:hypothetical protein